MYSAKIEVEIDQIEFIIKCVNSWLREYLHLSARCMKSICAKISAFIEYAFNNGPVIDYEEGGATKLEVGSEVLPLRKGRGGGRFFLAMLKGSFYTGGGGLAGGGGRKVLPFQAISPLS